MMRDVAKQKFGENEMVARVEVSIGFEDGNVAACGRHATDTRWYAEIVGQCGIEELEEASADIGGKPTVKNVAEKRAPLCWADRKGRNGAIGVGKAGKSAVGAQSFDDGCELNIGAVDALEEVVEVVGSLGVCGVYGCECVPLDFVLSEQIDAVHRLRVCWCVGVVHVPIEIVQVGRSVYGHSNEPTVVVEEACVVVGYEGAVGL